MDSPQPVSPRRDLVAYLDGLHRRLQELIPQAFEQGQVEAIHQARVSTRRLTAAVELFSPILPEKSRVGMRKALKKLRRRLGELRDLDVMLGHLTERKPAKRYARYAEWAVHRLSEARKELATQTQADVDVSELLGKLGAWWAIRGEVSQHPHRQTELLTQSLAAQVQDFAGRAVASDGDPHELRIAGKQLRYTFEMAKEAGLSVPSAVAKVSKKMQDELGLWHDYVVLAMRLMREAIDGQVAVHDCKLFDEALALAREMNRRAERHLALFHQLWEQRGSVLREAMAQPPKTDPAETPAPEPEHPATA